MGGGCTCCKNSFFCSFLHSHSKSVYKWKRTALKSLVQHLAGSRFERVSGTPLKGATITRASTAMNRHRVLISAFESRVYRVALNLPPNLLQKRCRFFFFFFFPLTFVFIAEVQVIIVAVVLRERRAETTKKRGEVFFFLPLHSVTPYLETESGSRTEQL